MGNSCWRRYYDSDDEEKIDYSGTNVRVVKNKESLDRIISESTKSNKIVVVSFSAAWCGPCIAASRFYIEASKKYPHFLFLAVDIDDLDELATAYGVDATPTFYILLRGITIDTLVGAHKDQFQKKNGDLIEFLMVKIQVNQHIKKIRLAYVCCCRSAHHIRNDNIRDREETATIEEKLVQHCSRWFGHIYSMRPLEAPAYSRSGAKTKERQGFRVGQF